MWPRRCTLARIGKVALNLKNPSPLLNSRPRHQHRYLFHLKQGVPWQRLPLAPWSRGAPSLPLALTRGACLTRGQLHRRRLQRAVSHKSLHRLKKRPLRRRTIHHCAHLRVHPKLALGHPIRPLVRHAPGAPCDQGARGRHSCESRNPGGSIALQLPGHALTRDVFPSVTLRINHAIVSTTRSGEIAETPKPAPGFDQWADCHMHTARTP